MKNNKSRKNGAKIRTPLKKLTGKETIEHYNAILLEEIRSDMRAVVTETEDTKNSLHREIAEFREEVNDRFNILEAVVRNHSKEINGLSGEVKKHGEAIDNLSGEVKKHGEMIRENSEAICRVEQKVDKIAVSVESHETRLTVVEEKVESHLAIHP